MFDLIVIGDTVIDTYIPLFDAKIISDDQNKLIALPFGLKVPVGSSVSQVAGNAANCAVGASRLDLHTAIYTNVGNLDDDADDDRIKNKLKKEGVDIRYIVETQELPSNHNIVLSYKGERTILTYHQPWKFKLPDLEKAKYIYLTSLSPSYLESNLISELINYLERTGAKLSFQPGTFQLKAGLNKNSRLFSLTDVLILNKEEAQGLLGLENIDDIKIMLTKILNLGVKRAVITDGKNGSYATDGEKFLKLDIFPADLVEITGAGDSYASALVAALIYGKDLDEAMRWGAANSASVVEQIGPQKGLLNIEQLNNSLNKNKKIVASNF